MMHFGFVAAIVVTVVLQSSGLDNRLVALFLGELQRDVARDDRAAVSARIQYPLTVRAGGVRIPIRDAADLLEHYDVVFTPALKALISQAALPARGGSASATSVAVTADMVTIGVDAVRIERLGEGLRITGITVPLEASSAEKATGAKGGARDEPQRLFVDIGRIQRRGALARGERDGYLLSARKNQLLEVRINGVAGREIIARIVSLKTRAAIDARAQDGVRTWIGRIPEDGDYRIDVVRLAPEGATRLPYVLVLSMR